MPYIFVSIWECLAQTSAVKHLVTEWLEFRLKVPSSSALPIKVAHLVMRFFENQSNVIVSHLESSSIKNGPEKFIRE